MGYRIHEAARRHGITDAAMVYVVEHWPDAVLVESTRADRQDVSMFPGTDPSGRELEVGVIDLGTGSPMIIHAMRMRPRYRAVFRALLEQR